MTTLARSTPPAPADVEAALRTWRPMPFGTRPARAIQDPVVEPLWPGIRSLASIDGPASGTAGEARVLIRDTSGSDVRGHDTIKPALATATLSTSAILDGYLTAAAIRPTVGIATTLVDEVAVSPAQTARQLFMFGGGRNRRKEQLAAEKERHAPLPTDRPIAFVAIDLIWLDGEPLLDVPLLERKRLLDSILVESEVVRLGAYVRPPIEPWYGQWRSFDFHEIAVKAANSRYTPGTPQPDWSTAFIPRA